MRLVLVLSGALIAAAIARAAEAVYPSSAGNLAVQTVATSLVHPWSLAFLPDGRILVTERPGRMRLVTQNGQLSPPLANVPKVFAASQGGLLDVILDRGFAQNRTIYFSYAEPFNGGGRTALARARLDDSAAPRLTDVKVIYRQYGPPSHGNHFGSRIVQATDGTLFVTNGEHFTDRDMAQTLDNDLGKIVRISPMARRPLITRLPTGPGPGPKSGPMATAIRRGSR